MKRYKLGIIILIITLVGTLWVVPQKIKTKLEATLQEYVDGKVSIEALSITYLPLGIALYNLDIQYGKGQKNTIKINQLKSKISLKNLFQRQITISDLLIDKIIINTKKDTLEGSNKTKENRITKQLTTNSEVSGNMKLNAAAWIDQSQLSIINEAKKINQKLDHLIQEWPLITKLDEESKQIELLRLKLANLEKKKKRAHLTMTEAEDDQLSALWLSLANIENQLKVKKIKQEKILSSSKEDIKKLAQFADNDYQRITKKIIKNAYQENSITNTLITPYITIYLKNLISIINKTETVLSGHSDVKNMKLFNFLVKKIEGSGQYNGQSFDFKIKNLTNMTRLKSPIEVEISHIDNQPNFNIRINTQLTHGIQNHDITFQGTQIDIPKFTLYEVGSKQISLHKGELSISGNIKLIENQLAGYINAIATNITYQKELINAAFSVPYLLYQTLQKIKEPVFNSVIEGSSFEPVVRTSSHIDKHFLGVVRLITRKQLTLRKEVIKKELNTILLMQHEKLIQQLPENSVEDKIDQLIQVIGKLKDEIKSKINVSKK